MKYLVGFESDFEEKLANIGNELESDSTSEERAKELIKLLKLDENVNADELSMLDIVPAIFELMLGVPAEILTKPMVHLTEEDMKLYDEALDRVMTVFTSNK